jgi:hypothetical protein
MAEAREERQRTLERAIARLKQPVQSQGLAAGFFDNLDAV